MKATPLLTGEFLSKKLDNYIEPERKGVPKGEPIGFSKKKLEASLFVLFNFSKKDIASLLGISYNLLRKKNPFGFQRI